MADHTCVLTVLLVTLSAITAAAVTVEVDSDVTLECPLSGDFPAWLGPPPNNTALTSNNTVTTDGMEYINDKDLRILNITTSNAGVYTCNTGNDEATVELVVNSFEYKVKFLNEHDLYSQTNTHDPDYDVFIAAWDGSESFNRDPNEKAMDLTITCVVENAFPEPQVVVEFLDETGLTITDTISSSALQADNTYTVTAYINVTFSKELNEREVACVASSGANSTRKQSRVRVVYPPSGVQYNSPGYIDERRMSGSFGCRTDFSWPMVDIRWSINGSQNTRIPGFLPNQASIPCKRLQTSDGHRFQCEKEQSFANLTRTYNGIDVSCSFYFLGQYFSHKNWTLHIVFPPSSVSLPGPVQAVSGKNATLTCTASLASYGTNKSGVSFYWNMGGEDINATQVSYVLVPGQYDGFITIQTVTFPVTRDMDGAEVECEANNGAGTTFDPSDSTTFDIQYAPVIVRPFQSVIQGYEGLRLNMFCAVDSKPVSNLTWYFLSHSPNGSLHVSLKTRSRENNQLSAYVSENNRVPETFFRCVADNGIEPEASKDIKVILREKPDDPIFDFTSVESNSIIVMVYLSDKPVEVPRFLFVQYKQDGAPYYAWLEADYGTRDTEPGHGWLRPNAVHLYNLLPDTLYNFRLRIVDINGFSYYSEKTIDWRTAGAEEETKTQSEYRNAILISVFVTFGVMLIILIVAVVLVKNGKCGGQKSTIMEYTGDR